MGHLAEFSGAQIKPHDTVARPSKIEWAVSFASSQSPIQSLVFVSTLLQMEKSTPKVLQLVIELQNRPSIAKPDI